MNNERDFIEKRVHDYFWKDGINCAGVMLRVLSEHFDVKLHAQVLDASQGMHGAGKYGAQCGLLEAGLMFIGVLAGQYGFDRSDVETYCSELARSFEARFGSLLCSVLRPEEFMPDNPFHLCEGLTCDAAAFNIEFISEMV